MTERDSSYINRICVITFCLLEFLCLHTVSFGYGNKIVNKQKWQPPGFNVVQYVSIKSPKVHTTSTQEYTK